LITVQFILTKLVTENPAAYVDFVVVFQEAAALAPGVVVVVEYVPAVETDPLD
jgi:hypothetical protein